ncbi:MAG TPA: prepilin-type N-terminal cleavage/methylation domain-containing protein [Candidatus Binatia bacterium]|nr:prepilin-type N-terminal cleavage/methylation domain-containing protein [Candidatus Binatia bacterium]
MKDKNNSGFTLVEIVVGVFILALVAISFTALFTGLVNSSVVAKQKAVASTLATNQMEYLKSLPYDSLAVAGGNIISTTYIPATSTQVVNGVRYTVKTDIQYADDAYDGCGTYQTQTMKQEECRNYPPPAGAPATDQAPWDYKDAQVSVYNRSGTVLASVDTQISARVAETSSTTGALFVTVIDSSNNPVLGANVHLVNSTVNPAVDANASTDQYGIATFYKLPPDNGYDYVITASLSGYSTLATIPPSGSLVPINSSQKILTQQTTYLTMTIKLQGPDSLLLETTDVNGNPLPGVKVYVKGGYKKYTLNTDTSYCYDTITPTLTGYCIAPPPTYTSPVTDSGGLAGLSNLVPGPYIFCGDAGATGCSIGGTTYYLAAAVPYSGTNILNPVNVPIYNPSSPPSTTYSYNSHNYYQKVRLMLTTSSSFPRVLTISPDDESLTSGTIANFGFQVTGANLPVSTVVKFSQGANVYTASCTGNGSTTLNCTVNLTGISTGSAQISISANGFTLNLPTSPLQGYLNVTP